MLAEYSIRMPAGCSLTKIEESGIIATDKIKFEEKTATLR